MTFDLCKSLVDEWILVTEEEISKAVYHFMENHHKVSRDEGRREGGSFFSGRVLCH